MRGLGIDLSQQNRLPGFGTRRNSGRMPDHAVTVSLANRGALAVSGPDAEDFLQGLVTNDVTALSADRALYAALLSPQGKIVCDFFLLRRGEDIVLELEKSAAGDLMQRLQRYKLRAKVQLADKSNELASVAVIGVDAEKHLGLSPTAGTASPFGEGIAFVDPRYAGLGVRFLLPRAQADAAMKSLGLPQGDPLSYDELRMGFGIAEGDELARDGLYPLEANFEELNGVDFKKGCYVGQELTARMKHKTELRKRVLPVIAETLLPEPGTDIGAEDVVIGTLIGRAHAKGLGLLRLDRLALATANSEPLYAGEVVVRAERPAWML